MFFVLFIQMFSYGSINLCTTKLKLQKLIINSIYCFFLLENIFRLLKNLNIIFQEFLLSASLTFCLQTKIKQLKFLLEHRQLNKYLIYNINHIYIYIYIYIHIYTYIGMYIYNIYIYIYIDVYII